jgi:hypothetical protein
MRKKGVEAKRDGPRVGHDKEEIERERKKELEKEESGGRRENREMRKKQN